MTWLYIAILAYFFYAVNSILDRFFLVGPISNPIVYSFYVGILSIFALLFFPFGPVWPEFSQLIINLLVGALFLFALVAIFYAIKKDEASRAVPIIGGFSPIFVFILSYSFLGERLGRLQIMAFLFLVLGGLLISVKKSEAEAPRGKKYSFKGFGTAVLAAFLFGAFFVSVKFVYIHQPFLSGFIWTRVGSFLAAFLLLIPRGNRKAIFGTTKTLKTKIGALVVSNKALAGIAFILLNYAISLGSATLVNALQGIQYALLLILVVFVSKISPQILKEKISVAAITQKIFAILLIGAGLVFLGFYS